MTNTNDHDIVRIFTCKTLFLVCCHHKRERHTINCTPSLHGTCRPCQEASVLGCTALLQWLQARQLQHIAEQEGCGLIEAYIQGVHVPGLAVRERLACLKLWHLAIQVECLMCGILSVKAGFRECQRAVYSDQLIRCCNCMVHCIP